MKDFEKYASGRKGLGPAFVDGYMRQVANYINPCIIEERRLNVTSMDVFSRLMMDRIIFIGTVIDDDVANIVQAQLLYLSSVSSQDKISIYINTPGGLVSSGLAIYDTMQLIAPEVETICTGMAASMGAILLSAGAKGKRSILPHARVMIHQPAGGAQGQAVDVLIAAKELVVARKELSSLLALHTGQDSIKVFSDIDRDFWMNAEDAKNYGIVDNVLAGKK